MYIYACICIYVYMYICDIINNTLEKASDRISSIAIDRDGLLSRRPAEIFCGVLYMQWDFRTARRFVRTSYGYRLWLILYTLYICINLFFLNVLFHLKN